MLYLFIIYFVLCLGVGYLGAGRKMGFWGYFFFALFFSPIIALLLVLVSDKKAKPPPAPTAEQVIQLIDSNEQLRADLKNALAENRRLIDRIDRKT